MDSINKQRFLAELSRLLTFMYEEDRQEALAMYSSMFDEAEDENKLLQLLMSPTRQAVVVARAYDAKDRKLQVKSQSREEGGRTEGETPDFALAIEKIRKEAEEKEILHAGVSDDQFSFFDEPEEEVPAEVPAEEPAAPAEPFIGEAVPDSFDTVSEAEKPEEPDVDAIIGEVSAFEREPDEAEPEAAEAVEAVEPDESAEAAEPEPAAEESVPAEEDAAAGEPEEEAEEPEEPAVEVPDEAPAAAEAEEEPKPFDYTKDIPNEDGEFEPEKKAMLGWLTLFVIFAIPIGFVAVLGCIVLALVFLALAAGVVAAGIFAIKSLFSGFAVLADMLLVGGAAIGALALGLLFLWTAIWFLFGAIPGVIRGLIELGRNWCYKEVAK